jgi:O-acetyl-ADP-ribose deacetylase (regulator of RNase III)
LLLRRGSIKNRGLNDSEKWRWISMPLMIVRNDITKMKVDAIVNAANSSLLGGGGVDGCIHRAAGPKLLEECRRLNGCRTGSAKITGAGKLPCKYVIHAVGPKWNGGNCGERELLISCYRTSLALAREAGCESIAFPLISSGIYGYPKDQALQIAVDTAGAFLAENDMTVYIVIFDKAAYQIGEKLFADITDYIDDHYVEEQPEAFAETARKLRSSRAFDRKPPVSPPKAGMVPMQMYEEDAPLICSRPMAFQPSVSQPSAPQWASAGVESQLKDALKQLDESFSEMLLRKIDEKNMTDAQCYKRANIDRKLFSKIRGDRLYRPSKPTVLAFAIALELSPDETADMLRKAGFALSRSSKFDIIVEFFIRRGNYNIHEINEALFAFDQSLLG